MNYTLRRHRVTLLLLAVTLVVFVAMQILYGPQATRPQVIYQFGGMFGLAVRAMPSQLWRLVTPIFVHIGWEHLLVNGLTLYFVGQLAERIWGSAHFFLLYLLAGMMGNAFTLALSPAAVAAGASTSLFGVFAAIMILGLQTKNPLLRSLGRSYLSLIVVNLVLNLFMPNVGIAGHLGGAIGGALAALFLPNQIGEQPLTKSRSWLAALGFLVLFFGLVAYSFA